jgi:16S rRNA (guanine(966)-N(2))-methyltransferase RsmD
MIRVIAGNAKGRKLQTPPGLQSRPTAARVRQTLFDILAPRLSGCRFLDVCAGSGAVGLEALSRGASRVVLVDDAAMAIQAIRANAELLRAAGGEVEVLRQEARVALGALAQRGQLFDLVYLDPPYGSDLYEQLLEAAAPLVAAGGLLIAERFKKRALPERIGGLATARSVRVGDHVLDFYAWQVTGGARP